jgi:hypothetical protein
MHVPIVRNLAKHTGAGAASAKASQAMGLQRELYLAIGALVSLTTNLWVERRLTNGSTGRVVDVIWGPDDDSKTPNLPLCVVVDFPDYNGPPFFSGEGRETWVPIPPITASWYIIGGRQPDGYSTCTRTMLPLRLRWA